MALNGDLLKTNVAPMLAIGSTIVLVPRVLPAVGWLLRPVAKTAVKAGLLAYAAVGRGVAGLARATCGTIAEARAELAKSSTKTESGAKGLRVPISELKRTTAEAKQALAGAARGRTKRDHDIVEPRSSEPKEEANLIVYFRKPADWSDALHVYYWNTQPAVPSNAWPGVPMTPDADGWFAHRLAGVQAAALIFHDGTRRQTADLHRDRSGWFDADGQWYDRKP